MPEMFQYCGQRLQVAKRAHKTCDPPSGLQARRMANAVHLTGIRCDGQAHGGCQAGCLIFWNEAWLKRPDSADPRSQPPLAGTTDVPASCTEQDVLAGAQPPCAADQSGEQVYVCQSTRVHSATEPLPWWDLRQYAEDVTSGNVGLSQMAAALLHFVFHNLVSSGIGLGLVIRWAYDTFQRIRGGAPYPSRPGRIPSGMRTPSAKLDLRPGDRIKVRSYPEILETLDQNWRNRGMYFDSELVPFCGGSYTVLQRVERIIDEKTGKMMHLKSDAVILQDVACGARYAKCRRFCPRGIYPFWREIWLERTPGDGAPPD
jgi:hypothetical protein